MPWFIELFMVSACACGSQSRWLLKHPQQGFAGIVWLSRLEESDRIAAVCEHFPSR